jgi:hypothetical protein
MAMQILPCNEAGKRRALGAELDRLVASGMFGAW